MVYHWSHLSFIYKLVIIFVLKEPSLKTANNAPFVLRFELFTSLKLFTLTHFCFPNWQFS